MSHKVRMSTISPLDKRNDLHQTTSGNGHSFRPPIPFLSSDCKIWQRTKFPLPQNLSAKTNLSGDTFITTAGKDYINQQQYLPGESSIVKKSPSLMKVNYTLNTINQLSQKPWRRGLTMGNQLSETHNRFAGLPDTITSTLPQCDPMPDILTDHHNEGPMKQLPPTTLNTFLKGKPFIPQYQGVLDRREPYMTTNNWYHRTFSAHEMVQYPKKDAATYWECENYPKAWGFGLHKNPLPPQRQSKTSTGASTMRDRMVFSHDVKVTPVTRIHQPMLSGLTSHYKTSYPAISDQDRAKLFYCPVVPAIRGTVNDTSVLMNVPKMYQTQNQQYGNEPVAAQ